MATGVMRSGRLQSLLKYAGNRALGIGAIKCYSVFPKHYQPPVFRKTDQAVLEQTGQLEELSHLQFLPAMKGQTSSEFYDPIVEKFSRFIMREGKKALARSLLQETFEKIKRQQLEIYHAASPNEQPNILLDPKEILYKAVNNSKPVMELKSMKKGGATYRVPVPVLENRQRFLAMNWLIEAAKDKNGRIPFTTQLAKELTDAANNEGRVVKKKQDLHKQCEANRAYAHFRWS